MSKQFIHQLFTQTFKYHHVLQIDQRGCKFTNNENYDNTVANKTINAPLLAEMVNAFFLACSNYVKSSEILQIVDFSKQSLQHGHKNVHSRHFITGHFFIKTILFICIFTNIKRIDFQCICSCRYKYWLSSLITSHVEFSDIDSHPQKKEKNSKP